MKIAPDRNVDAKRLVDDLMTEVTRLRENNLDAYHAALMEKAAIMLAKSINYIPTK